MFEKIKLFFLRLLKKECFYINGPEMIHTGIC